MSHGVALSPAPLTGEATRLYQADPVDAYIADLKQQLVELKQRVEAAIRSASAAEDRVAILEPAEAVLGRMLLSAHRAADAAMADATQRGDGIIAAACREADAQLEEASRQAQDIIAETHDTVEELFASLGGPETAQLVLEMPLGATEHLASFGPVRLDRDRLLVDIRWDRTQPGQSGESPRSVGGSSPHSPRNRQGEPSGDDRFARVEPLGPVAHESVDRPAPPSTIRDRWRLARSGASPDELLTQRDRLESLADGSFLDELREPSEADPLSGPADGRREDAAPDVFQPGGPSSRLSSVPGQRPA